MATADTTGEAIDTVASVIEPEQQTMSTVPSNTVILAGTWAVDPAHSSIGFAVRHMGLATVRGVFTAFEGTIEIGDDPSTAKGSGTVKAQSVDTNEPQRDGHLLSPDFLDAAPYAEISFESTRIVALDDETFRITGQLTIYGVTNEIVLHAEVQGTDVDPWGQRAATSASASRSPARSHAASTR